MDYRNFGRTGVKVSPLCLGCMTFGARTSEEEAFAMVDRAMAAGINFVDTANTYGRGASETIVGKAMKRDGKRERIVLATKVHGRMDDSDPNMSGNHRRHILQSCEQSLKRLQTDWIDLYQMHRPVNDVPIDETLRALDDLVRAGKVRYIGTSDFAAWQLMESLWISKELRLNRFVSDQPPYNLLDRRVERELVPMALTYGFAIIPFSPLAAGFLTGKYQRGQTPTSGRWEGGKGPAGRQLNEAAYELVDALRPLASEKGCSVGQFALAWCMQQRGITSPIIGPASLAQLEDNLGALTVQLTDADRQAVDRISPPGQMTVNYYQADWGPHAFRW